MKRLNTIEFSLTDQNTHTWTYTQFTVDVQPVTYLHGTFMIIVHKTSKINFGDMTPTICQLKSLHFLSAFPAFTGIKSTFVVPGNIIHAYLPNLCCGI